MQLDHWTTQGKDPLRQRRLAIGYGVGLCGVAVVATFITLTASEVAAESEATIFNVQLAEEPEPEPEPEPEVEQEAPKPKPKRRLAKLAAPQAVPDAVPEEAEPTDGLDTGEDPYAEGDDPAAEQAPPAPVVEQPKARPKPKLVHRQAPKRRSKGPIRVTENVTPPRALAMSKPSYPASAKQAGIQGTVVVKYVVADSGSVTNVKVLRGPAELRAACVTAVRAWKFRPAVLDGRPVAVYRIARFPFRIRT